jgi:serine/threonine-protein kinase HipA
VPAILKFDGVGETTVEGLLGEPQPFNRVEAAYARMARAAGLDVVDVAILETGSGHAHLIVPRFDRRDGRRLHQHTLGGLLHVDYNDPGASSYEEYLRTMLRLGLPPAAIVEGYRRMVFNVVAVNQDDHVKNLSFHQDPSGAWALAPAYDLTFAMGGGWTEQHQMRLADKRSGITRADLTAVAETFGIRNPGGIIGRIEAAVARWDEYAQECQVPADATARVGAALRRRQGELRGA